MAEYLILTVLRWLEGVHRALWMQAMLVSALTNPCKREILATGIEMENIKLNLDNAFRSWNELVFWGNPGLTPERGDMGLDDEFF